MLTLMFPDGNNYVSQVLDERCNPQKTRCIDGSVTSRSKCSGYCVCNLHTGYLTQQHIEKHNCIEKECAYFYSRTSDACKPESTFKAAKAAMKQNCNEVLESVRSVIADLDGMCVTSVKSEKSGYVVFYAAIAQYDLQKIAENLLQIIGAEIEFKALPGGFDTHLELVMAK